MNLHGARGWRRCAAGVALAIVTTGFASAGQAGIAVAESPPSRWDLAREEAPRPYGVGVNVYHQEQGYGLERFRVNVISEDLSVLDDLDIENEVLEINMKADAWVLPMLNVYGILGYVDGTTEVDLPIFDKLKIEYEGLVYGVGATVAAGWDAWFLTLTGAITETDLDTSDSAVKAWIFTPKLGVKGRYGAVWAGAMYQEAEEEHEGRINVPVYGDVEYDVTLQQEAPWNYLVGYAGGWGEHVAFDLEAGFGDRVHASASVTYRF